MLQHYTNFNVQRLSKDQHMLLRKFYRNHKSSMKITQNSEAWVVRTPAIVAGVCLSPITGGYWLTSLYTAPQYRRLGVASLLIKHLQTTYHESPIWLFCHPNLKNFYHSLNFKETQHLPSFLSQRLTRYQQHKSLLAMLYAEQTDST